VRALGMLDKQCIRAVAFANLRTIFIDQLLVHAICDLRWRRKIINAEFAESIVVNVLMLMEGSR
jgi:hypothetical protein